MEYSNIDKLLMRNRTDGPIKTHVTMGRYLGSYMFGTRSMDQLFETYCEDIMNGVNVCLAETKDQSNLIPVLVDIDIKVKETDDILGELGESLYTDNHVQTVVGIYQSVIRKIVETCTDEMLLCVVLEKPSYRDKVNDVSYLKNGFHLHFPNVFIHTDDQKTHLIPRVNQEIEAAHVFDVLADYGCTVKVDEGYCSAPWLMYGSKKDANKQAYRATKAINAHGEVLSIRDAFRNCKVYDSTGYVIRIEKPIEYYLPRILSILPIPSSVRKRTAIKPQLLSPIKEKIKKQAMEKQRALQYKKSVEEDMRVARNILPMLADFRASERSEWIKIGWLLYTISQGSDEGLELWCDFSSRCEEKYNEASCIDEWGRMVVKNLTLGTLRYMAMQDSPQEYEVYKKESTKKFMRDKGIAISGTHWDIASLLFEEFKDEWICASPGKNSEWYRFNGLRWKRDVDALQLKQMLATHVVELYRQMLEKQQPGGGEESSQSDDDKKRMAKMKLILKIIENLKNIGFMKSVIETAQGSFFKENFLQLLDANKYLIGFKNGVYDLKEHKFRNGIPEDYISLSLGIEYKEFDPDGEEVRMVHDYLEKVFPNKNIRKYFLDIYSDIFVGGNQRKHIIFWTGCGDNAKSVTQTIFEKMMGEYATKLETQNVTGKRPNSGAANADIARLESKRLVSIDEPDKKEEFNIGVLKHLSGNDTCYARDLFQRGKDTREFLPLFKLIIICNDLPPITHDDQAIWNRVRVIDFESVFCDPDKGVFAPESYEEQLRQKRFPVDKTFTEDKMPRILEPFAWVLLNHRKNIGCVIEPMEVKVSTEQFRKTNDLYRQFREECVMQASTDKCITLNELYTRFKQWYKDAYPGYAVPIKEEVKKQYINMWKSNFILNSWYGLKLKTDEDIRQEALLLLQEKERREQEELIAAFDAELAANMADTFSADTSNKRKREGDLSELVFENHKTHFANEEEEDDNDIPPPPSKAARSESKDDDDDAYFVVESDDE